MGNDQHGPAYPEPPQYRCPICRGDENRYSSCEYPGCPDGRDRHHPYAKYLASLRRTVEEPGDPHLDHAIGPRLRWQPPMWVHVLIALGIGLALGLMAAHR